MPPTAPGGNLGPAKNVGELGRLLEGCLPRSSDRIQGRAPEQLEAEEAAKRLRRAGVAGRFHWSLEFPEVFARPGRIRRVRLQPAVHGRAEDHRQPGHGVPGLSRRAPRSGKRGSADLCCLLRPAGRFFVAEGGQFGFLATNTIAQGDTREVGLDQLTADGCVIPRAVPSRTWPGTASLEVAHVWPAGDGGPAVRLDEKPVAGSRRSSTEPGAVIGPPHRLAANAGSRSSARRSGHGFRDGARRGPTAHRQEPPQQGRAVPLTSTAKTSTPGPTNRRAGGSSTSSTGRSNGRRLPSDTKGRWRRIIPIV